ALTLPFAFPTPGVEYSFRSPVLPLGLAVAGVGAGFVAGALRPRLGARAGPAVLLAVAALSALSFALPGRRDLARVSPEYAESRFVEARAPELPRDITWLTLPPVRDRPSYFPALGPLRRAGISVHRQTSLEAALGAPRPVYFLDGVECRAWGLGELM